MTSIILEDIAGHDSGILDDTGDFVFTCYKAAERMTRQYLSILFCFIDHGKYIQEVGLLPLSWLALASL